MKTEIDPATKGAETNSSLPSKLSGQNHAITWYLAILGVYFLLFLLLTPLGKFSPKAPGCPWYSLDRIDPWDDTAYYMVAKSSIVDGDFVYFDEPLKQGEFYRLTPNGNLMVGANIPIGPSILWSPYVLLAHGLTKLANMIFEAGLEENGYSRIYLLVTALGSSLYAFLSLLIGFRILTYFFAPRVALLSVLTIFVSNSALYFSYVRVLMSHTSELFAISLFVYFFVQLSRRAIAIDYLFFGLSAGLMVIVRYDNAIFLVLPLTHLVHTLIRCLQNKRWSHALDVTRGYGLAVGAALFPVMAQFGHFYVQSGALVPHSLQGVLSTVFDKTVLAKELFFGETRNILWGTPVVTLGAVGSLLFIRKERMLGIGLTAVVLAGLLWLFWRPHAYWWGMDFGIRHLIKLSVPLSFGYASIISLVRMRGAFIGFLMLSSGIGLWEYLKMIQVPSITPVLTDGFLGLAGKEALELISSNPARLLLGMDCSYIYTLVTHWFKLEVFSVQDWLYGLALPLSVLGLCFLWLAGFLFFDASRVRKTKRLYAMLTACMIFFGLLTIAGFAYPPKSADEMYEDFKRGAVLAFEGKAYKASAENVRNALNLKPEGDLLVKGILKVLHEQVRFPCFFNVPAFVSALEYASRDENEAIREWAGRTATNREVSASGLFDLGENAVRPFLKGGWSGNEGPYRDLGFPTFVWAVGKTSEMEIDLCGEKSDKILRFRAFPFMKGQSMDVDVNEIHIASIRLVKAWQEYEVPIHSGHLNLGPNKITFTYKETRSPSESGSGDKRELAVAFDWVSIENEPRKEDVPK